MKEMTLEGSEMKEMTLEGSEMKERTYIEPMSRTEYVLTPNK